MVKTAGMKCVAKSVVLEPQGSLPTGEEGKLIYDNASKSIKIYNGSQWEDLAPSIAVVDAYSPNYIVDTCEDFTTTDPYTISATAGSMAQPEDSMNTYLPTNWNCFINTILGTMDCCQELLSPLYHTCLKNYGYIGCQGCICGTYTPDYMYQMTCNRAVRPMNAHICVYRKYDLVNQSATSDFEFSHCISNSVNQYQIASCYQCSCTCHTQKVTFVSTDSTVCDVVICDYYNMSISTASCYVTYNGTFTYCVCPSENCIYTNTAMGNIAFDFGTHGFLCEIRTSNFTCHNIKAWGINSTSNRECLRVFTGAELTEYAVDFLYKTSCQNITLPKAYKTIMPSFTGAVKPMATPLYMNYCAVGIGDYTGQRNFEMLCDGTGTDCITDYYSQFCINSSVTPNCFSFATCTDCLLCCWCIDTPTYDFTISPSLIVNRLFAWEEIQ